MGADPVVVKHHRGEKIRKRLTLRAPTHVGQWYWEEWKRVVTVYKKKGGRHLYVKPTDTGPEVRITPRIAGGWRALPEDG